MARIPKTCLGLVLAGLLLSQSATGFPLSANGDSDQMSIIGRWAEGPGNALVAMGDTLIFHHGGLMEIADFSNPLSPITISQFEIPTYPVHLVYGHDQLVISDGENVLTFVDLTNPAEPLLASSLALDERIDSFSISGGWLYVLANDEGAGNSRLMPVDIGNPDSPVAYPPTLLIDGGDFIAADAGRLVVLQGNHVLVYGLGAPAAPNFLGDSWISGYGGRVVVSGGLAFIVSNDELNSVRRGHLYVMDISGLGIPDIIGETIWPIFTDGYAFSGMSLNGTTIYTLDNYGVIYSCEVANPQTPTLLDVLDTGGTEPTDMAVSAGQVFCNLTYDPGMVVVDAQNPASLAVTTTLEFGKSLYGVSVDFNRAYVYAHENMIDILDVTQPESPVKLGRVDTGDEVWGLDARGDFLYVCNDLHMVNVYDVSNPMSPLLTDQIGTGNYGEFLVERNGLVYVGGNSGLTIVDVHDPYDIRQLGFLDMGSSPRDFDVVGGHVFAITYGPPAEFSVVDSGNPQSPQVVGSLAFQGEGAALAVDNGFAYVVVDSMGSTELKIIDISDPTQPTLVSSFPIPVGKVYSSQTGKGATVDGGFLYLAASNLGVLVYDVSNPSDPVEYGFFNTGDNAGGLVCEFNRVFVADRYDGLYILRTDAHEPTGVEPSLAYPLMLSQNYPNPFNPQTTIAFDLPGQTAVRLAVYDVSGRLVNVLLDGDNAAQGRNEVVWRGRDMAGRVVSAGVYFYRLEAGSFSDTKRMTLLK